MFRKLVIQLLCWQWYFPLAKLCHYSTTVNILRVVWNFIVECINALAKVSLKHTEFSFILDSFLLLINWEQMFSIDCGMKWNVHSVRRKCFSDLSIKMMLILYVKYFFVELWHGAKEKYIVICRKFSVILIHLFIYFCQSIWTLNLFASYWTPWRRLQPMTKQRHFLTCSLSSFCHLIFTSRCLMRISSWRHWLSVARQKLSLKSYFFYSIEKVFAVTFEQRLLWSSLFCATCVS